MENNAVFREVLKISSQWDTIRKEDVEDIQIFCWKGNKIELQFVDAFIKYKLSGSDASEDIFLLFINPFSVLMSYGHDIITDMQHVLDGWYEGLNETQQAQKEKWNTEEKSSKKDRITDVHFFAHNINKLPNYYGLSPKNKLFIVLSPSDVTDIYNFNIWISMLIEEAIHPSVKFIMYDNREHPLYKKVTKNNNSRVLYPEIDPLQVISEVHNEIADPKDPATIFQKALLEASKLLGDKKQEKALQKTLDCISIAKSNDLKDPLVSVYLFRSNIFMIAKDKKNALKEISLAVESSVHNTRLHLQSLLFKGGLLLRYSKNDMAYEVYKICVPLADEIKDDFLMIESRRLYGFFAEKNRDSDIAWEVYYQALIIAKAMDVDQVKASSIGLLGSRMVYMCSSYDYKFDTLYDEIEQLIGENWLEKQDSLRKAKEGTVYATQN